MAREYGMVIGSQNNRVGGDKTKYEVFLRPFNEENSDDAMLTYIMT